MEPESGSRGAVLKLLQVLPSRLPGVFRAVAISEVQDPRPAIDRLLAEVKRLNALRKIVIHTINIGNNQRGKVFLKALAEQNGGTFLDLGQ